MNDLQQREQREYNSGHNPQFGQKKKAFTLTMKLEMDLDLANELGNFILDNQPQNKAILSLGHQLVG